MNLLLNPLKSTLLSINIGLPVTNYYPQGPQPDSKKFLNIQIRITFEEKSIHVTYPKLYVINVVT